MREFELGLLVAGTYTLAFGGPAAERLTPETLDPRIERSGPEAGEAVAATDPRPAAGGGWTLQFAIRQMGYYRLRLDAPDDPAGRPPLTVGFPRLVQPPNPFHADTAALQEEILDAAHIPPPPSADTQELRARLAHLEHEVARLRSSFSLRLGLWLTTPPRLLARWGRQLQHRLRGGARP